MTTTRIRAFFARHWPWLLPLLGILILLLLYLWRLPLNATERQFVGRWTIQYQVGTTTHTNYLILNADRTGYTMYTGAKPADPPSAGRWYWQVRNGQFRVIDDESRPWHEALQPRSWAAWDPYDIVKLQDDMIQLQQPGSPAFPLKRVSAFPEVHEEALQQAQSKY